jgi:hypothetical protein
MKRLIFLAIALLSAPLWGVCTSYWTQSSETDFEAGTMDSVVVTNRGELKLSRAVKSLLEQDPHISTVNQMIEAPDGTIYAGTGPSAILLQIKDQKVATVTDIPGATDILSLAIDKSGRLLLGTGGEKGGVYRIDKPGAMPHQIFAPDDTQYVWALAETPDGKLYAATGPTGKLFEVSPDGSSRVLLETEENNLLSLLSDGKDMLYVGTDPHGLVYRVNRSTGESFVVYNAAESEITALALDAQGNLYAATGEAHDEQGQQNQAAAPTENGGHPDNGAVSVPIPSSPPNNPKPPTPPDPNPGRPDPIPKQPNQSGQQTIFWNSRAHHSFCPRTAAVLTLDDGPDQPSPGGPPNRRPPVGVPGSSPQATPDTEPSTPDQTKNNGQQPPPNQGNAVYKIDPDGFVTEVFRQPVVVLSMVENNGVLLLGTGGEGQVFQVDPNAEETVVLAKVDAKDVTNLLTTRDGQIYVGMGNVGSIATMSDGFAERGTYISPVLDATQISRFGKLQLHGSLPPHTSLLVSTRSGNVNEASDKNWSKWSDDVSVAEFLPVKSPSARFLQYRFTFGSADAKATPVIDNVSVAYQMPNMAPQIKSIHIAPSGDASTQNSNAAANGASAAGGGGNGSAAAATPANAAANGPPGTATGEPDNHPTQPNPILTIAWDASDLNNDTLTYSLYFRQGSSDPWILLKKNLTDATFDWDTRQVADGRYQVKVVASDAASNPPGMEKTATRISDPVVVDNTPPIIGDVKWHQVGAKVHIELRAVDQTSTVASVEYAVDSSSNWQLVLPVDMIYDSPEEQVQFDLAGLSPGSHQVALRATDSKGNQSYENVFVKMEGPAAPR